MLDTQCKDLLEKAHQAY